MKRMLILLLVAITAAFARVKTETASRIQPGDPMPAFTVTTLSGEWVTVPDPGGRPTLAVFFSTTCPDCHRQLPEIEDAWKRSEGSLFLAVARDEGPEAVRRFWEAQGFTLPVAAPGNRSLYDLYDRGSRSGVPLVYISGPDGTVLLTADDRHLLTMEEILLTIGPR